MNMKISLALLVSVFAISAQADVVELLNKNFPPSCRTATAVALASGLAFNKYNSDKDLAFCVGAAAGKVSKELHEQFNKDSQDRNWLNVLKGLEPLSGPAFNAAVPFISKYGRQIASAVVTKSKDIYAKAPQTFTSLGLMVAYALAKKAYKAYEKKQNNNQQSAVLSQNDNNQGVVVSQNDAAAAA